MQPKPYVFKKPDHEQQRPVNRSLKISLYSFHAPTSFFFYSCLRAIQPKTPPLSFASLDIVTTQRSCNKNGKDFQSLADRRVTMRSPMMGLSKSRETIQSSAIALFTRLRRPRILVSLLLVVCFGYLLVVSSSRHVIDNSQLGLTESNTFQAEIEVFIKH